MPKQRLHVDQFLQPGQLLVTATPLTIKTILGSCVAICLWDPSVRVGGINHYLLARPNNPADKGNQFGSIAIAMLIDRMIRHGADINHVEASVVGGGKPVGGTHPMFVGKENRDVAIEMLAERGIRVVREDTGGNHGRKLLFDTGTGRLIIKQVRGLHPDTSSGA